MHFDPHAHIINRETGEPLLEESASDGRGQIRCVTLGFVVARALDAKYRDDETTAPSVLFERYKLASRIRKAPPGRAIDLSIDEAKLIKDTVPKVYPPGIWGQVWDHLEEAASPPIAGANGHAAVRSDP